MPHIVNKTAPTPASALVSLPSALLTVASSLSSSFLGFKRPLEAVASFFSPDN